MDCKFCQPLNNEHGCHCIYEAGKDLSRVAWGICCAREMVGVELMSEEDYHAQMPWSRPEDCTCHPKPEL